MSRPIQSALSRAASFSSPERSLAKAREALTTSQSQLATGFKIQRASDDPAWICAGQIPGPPRGHPGSVRDGDRRGGAMGQPDRESSLARWARSLSRPPSSASARRTVSTRRKTSRSRWTTCATRPSSGCARRSRASTCSRATRPRRRLSTRPACPSRAPSPARGDARSRRATPSRSTPSAPSRSTATRRSSDWRT